MFKESAEFYDAIYCFKDYATEAAQIAALVRATHPGARRVLDVACGTGEHARHLSASHGFEVDGLDSTQGSSAWRVKNTDPVRSSKAT